MALVGRPGARAGPRNRFPTAGPPGLSPAPRGPAGTTPTRGGPPADRGTAPPLNGPRPGPQIRLARDDQEPFRTRRPTRKGIGVGGAPSQDGGPIAGFENPVPRRGGALGHFAGHHEPLVLS